MSIWKRKKSKLAKAEKPEKEESVLKDFVDTLTYNKTEEEKKKTLTQMDADDKIIAVPTVPVGPQSSQVVTQAGPQQIVININIPAPLNKSEMNPEHKADMPKAPPLPKVPTITAKAPAAPRSPIIHTATVVQKSEEKPSLGEVIKNLPADKALALLGKIKPGKNLKKNMAQGYAGQPSSNLMQMSQEPLKKDVVDMSKWKRRKDKKEELDNLPTEQEMKDALFNPKPEPRKLHEDPLIDTLMQEEKDKQKNGVDRRSRDQKIKDALAAQADKGSPYSGVRSTGGGSDSSKSGKLSSKNTTAVDKDLDKREARIKKHVINAHNAIKEARQNPTDKKYRKLLEQRDSGDAALSGKSDMEIAKMAGIKMMSPAKPSKRPEPHEDVKGYLAARFSQEPEAMNRIQELWSKDHDEPYNDGVLGQTSWRQGKDAKVPQGWKEMPIASKATPQSIGGILGKKVISGEGPDPLHWIDAKYRHTLNLLEQHKDLPLHIHTRSDLIANDDYIDKLNPKKHQVNIHVAFPENKWDHSSDENVMEPGQPSTKRRLAAYEKLKAAGIPVKIIVDRLKSEYEHPLLTRNKAAASQLRDMGIPKEDINFNNIELDKHALNRIADKTGMPPHNPNRKKRHLSQEKKADNLSMIKDALSRRRN